MTPAERDEMLGKDGAVAKVLTRVIGAVLMPGHRRRERLVFG